MKIAVLAHSFPRFPGDTHGPFVKSLCEAVARRGHQVHVLIPFDTELRPDPSSPLSISSFRYVRPDRAHLLGYSRTLKADVGMKLVAYLLSPLYFLFGYRALVRLVRERDIEFIHAHWLLPNGYIAERVARRTGVPFACTLHGSDVFMAERSGLFRSMARTTVAGARHITSCSGDLRDRLIALDAPGARETIRLVPNGTDLELYRPVAPGQMRERLAIAESDRLIVGVGRMVYKKGFRYLLEAMPAVLAKMPDARLVLAGGGDIQAELEARAERLGIAQRVVFSGGLQHDEVLDLIAAAELFVMPSIRDPQGNIDGLPIVVLEAMAAAKPVIATGIAGMPLAVEHKRTGLLVPEQDPAALAAAVIELFESPDRARAFGQAGRERVESELNWDVIAERHDGLYRGYDG